MNTGSYIEEILLHLGDLKICFEEDNGKILTVNVIESPAFKYYAGEKINLEQFENKGDIFQSNHERADKVFDAIKNGSEKNFHICTDENNRILDGYLTSAAMVKLHGTDRKVKVKRFYFENLNDSTIVRYGEKSYGKSQTHKRFF